jgi:hypothetical protein
MADKQLGQKLSKFRVLKDFTDREGNEHKVDDEIELPVGEAQPHVNAGRITAEVRQDQPKKQPKQWHEE